MLLVLLGVFAEVPLAVSERKGAVLRNGPGQGAAAVCKEIPQTPDSAFVRKELF